MEEGQEEKKMSFYPRNQNNIINFPKNKKPNLKAEAVDKVIAKDLICIHENMKSDKWDIAVVPDHIIYTLSTCGEVLELEPIVARRLIANLSTVVMKLRDQIANPFGELT